MIARIVQLAFGQRQAPAADAAIEVLAQFRQHGDALVKISADFLAEFCPIGLSWCTLVGQGRQHVSNFGNGKAQLLGDQNK